MIQFMIHREIRIQINNYKGCRKQENLCKIRLKAGRGMVRWTGVLRSRTEERN